MAWHPLKPVGRRRGTPTFWTFVQSCVFESPGISRERGIRVQNQGKAGQSGKVCYGGFVFLECAANLRGRAEGGH